jgi:hypothetical protein
LCILVDHDLSMRILYRFHGWLIFVRVIALFMFVWPYVRYKRQMTSFVHKMCGQTYGQTNMKRSITLTKINHPWNRYNMRMLRSWSTKIPNMNKNPTKDKWLVTYTRFRDGRTDRGIPVYPPSCDYFWQNDLWRSPYYTPTRRVTCEEVLIIPPLAEWWVYWNTPVRPSVPKPCVRN